MGDVKLTLTVLPGRFGICRLDPDEVLPEWATGGPFFSITRSAEELSVVCAEAAIPEGAESEKGWRCMKFQGPLDFSLIGVLSSITAPLAKGGISIFAISTYNTDYVFVKTSRLEEARSILSSAGHRIVD
jgi:hypothetical protein